jgi:ADP-ribose pyrophosphatase YjhB (NUDIX family)
MDRQVWMPRLARLFRRFPWMVAVAERLWQLTQPKYSVGVVGVVFNEAGQVLLVEHVFHPYVPWGLPGGWTERREDPTETLRREFQEELSLAIEVGPVVGVNLDGLHVNLAYLCYRHGEVGALSFELLGHRWFDPAQLPKTHSFHISAIQAARHWLEVTARV